MRKNLTSCLLLCFFLLSGWTGLSPVNAQLAPDEGDVTISSDPDQSSVPIPVDGGLSVLLAAGAAYGFKKYRSEKRQKNHFPPKSIL